MERFEIELIESAYKRCFGLWHLVQKGTREAIKELSKQTGLNEKFIIGNIDEVKKVKNTWAKPKKLCYDDIKLNGKVRHPTASESSPNHEGKIVGIDNMAITAGIDEPVFIVKFRDFTAYFGLKYILKHYITD